MKKRNEKRRSSNEECCFHGFGIRVSGGWISEENASFVFSFSNFTERINPSFRISSDTSSFCGRVISAATHSISKGFPRVFIGKGTRSPPRRCDSKTAQIIPTVVAPFRAPHNGSRSSRNRAAESAASDKRAKVAAAVVVRKWRRFMKGVMLRSVPLSCGSAKHSREGR